MEEVRGRVRLLALLLFIAFAFDPTLNLIAWALVKLTGNTVPSEFSGYIGFALGDLAAAVASALLWWTARRNSVPPSRLHTLGLIYQVIICFQISLSMMWQWYLQKGSVPPLTWAPLVIVLFPLIMPGPPRRMLTAAIVAGAMSPLALLVLDLATEVKPAGEDYLRTFITSGFSVVFAYYGARVIYRLGRQVAAARELGSYRLEERLGQGGMGEVWRARHRMLARPAAIKLIRASGSANGRSPSSRDMVQRFEREAQVIARLRSPHTVDLFDYGVAENGSFYYVMELLEGLDADRLVRRFGPVSAARAIYLLTQVCHSLSEAESCGLIHRDIKPANIFLCRYGQDCDFVKVLDFGLVKTINQSPSAGLALTGENTVQGTPAFIAPEQALGRPDVDGRLDIYAVGCVAFWLLTGKLVFTADTAMGYLTHHIHTSPPRPSSLTELPVPGALDEVILSCLAKDPAERPSNAGELSLRLSALECTKEWDEHRAREWWDRHQPASASFTAADFVPDLAGK
jgi:serine/threonine-protein kinase